MEDWLLEKKLTRWAIKPKQLFTGNEGNVQAEVQGQQNAIEPNALAKLERN